MGTEDRNRINQATAMIAKECDRSAKKVWLFTWFERGLMLEVQVTLLAISRHILKTPEWGIPWHKQIDGQLLFSVCVSFACFFKAFFDHFDQYAKLSEKIESFSSAENLSP